MSNNSNNRLHYGWAVLAMGTLAVFGALGLARFGYAMVLPNMQAGLDMDNGQAGLLATVSLIGYLTMALLGGAWASRYGTRIVTTVGLLAAGFGMLFTGLSQSFASAVMWNGLTGMGSGAVNVAIMGLWPAWFAKKRRGLAAGIAVSGSSPGLLFTGFIVPKIISVYQGEAWKVSWEVFGVITLILAAGSYLIIRDNPEQVNLRPVGENGDGYIPAISKTKVPFKEIYFSPTVWCLGLVYFAFGFSYIIFMTFFLKHLVVTAGYSEASAGNLYMVIGAVSIVSGLIWGSVSDKIGRKTTLIIIYLIQAAAFTMFGLGTYPVFFVFSAVLFGLTAWSIPAIMSATSGDLLGPQYASATIGFITLFFGIGQVMGPTVAGFMADRANSFGVVFLVAAGFSFIGALAALFLIRSKAKTSVAADPVVLEKN